MDGRRLGLGDRIRFVGPLEQPAELFAAMDVFALTSREDPFPLVMLEAAAAGVPVVCFAGGGGARIVDPDAGRVAPYLDVAGMAAAISDLLERGEERQRMGRAAERVRKRHTVDQAGPVLVDVIRRSLGPEWDAARTSSSDRISDPRGRPLEPLSIAIHDLQAWLLSALRRSRSPPMTGLTVRLQKAPEPSMSTIGSSILCLARKSSTAWRHAEYVP